MTEVPEPYQITAEETLYRVVTPLGMALLALVQLPGLASNSDLLLGVHILVFILGIFVAFNQTIELLDRRLNWRVRVLTEELTENQEQ